ncbi:hypothetical protein V5799_020080 [Amblyomma americanum]|uniref:Uncharacterized protein n=1 Tax=Amblyomma americanum TaxID=6943 RepID=A0AAQ4EV30_AMBAM
MGEERKVINLKALDALAKHRWTHQQQSRNPVMMRSWSSGSQSLSSGWQKSQQEYLQWRENLLDEHRHRLKAVEEDYERQHRLDLERASNARQQAESLLLQLADAQAEIKRLETKMKSRIQQLKSEHLKELQALSEEMQVELSTKKSLYDEAAALSRDLQQQKLADKAKHDAELSSLLKDKAELEAQLKGQEALNEEVMSVLEKERSLNQELTSAMGQREKQIAVLEHEVYKLQSEEKHKDALLEVLSSKVSHDITLEGEAAARHGTLPQLVSQGTSPASSSHKTDSGVQGMSPRGRSHEEVSVCSVASQVSPQELSDLDQMLKNVTAKLNEKKAAVVQAKQLLRSTTNELHKLTKLAEERAEQLRRLQHRMQSSSTRASTPVGYEYKAGEDIHDIRTTSYGFVPCPSAPSAKAVRKVCYKKLTPTSKESLSTLANVSSIQNNCESSGGLPHFEFHSEEVSCASDNVFESTRLHEKYSAVKHASSKAAHSESQLLGNEPMLGGIERPLRRAEDCFECDRELKEESYAPETVLKSEVDDRDQRSHRTFNFGCSQRISTLGGPVRNTTPVKSSAGINDSRKKVRHSSAAMEEKSPGQKTISRSPWERNQCSGKNGRSHTVQSTPSYDFPLLGKNKVWSYDPCDCSDLPAKPASDSPWPIAPREEKKGARRSLTFPEEAALPAVPFACCAGTNSDTSLGVSRELSFRTAPFSTPVNVTVHVQAYPEPKDFHR